MAFNECFHRQTCKNAEKASGKEHGSQLFAEQRHLNMRETEPRYHKTHHANCLAECLSPEKNPAEDHHKHCIEMTEEARQPPDNGNIFFDEQEEAMIQTPYDEGPTRSMP